MSMTWQLISGRGSFFFFTSATLWPVVPFSEGENTTIREPGLLVCEEER